MKFVGATGMGVRVGVAFSRNKLALRIRLRNLNKIKFDSFRDIRVHTYDFFMFLGAKVGVANFFLGQLIGFDKTNTFQLKNFF